MDTEREVGAIRVHLGRLNDDYTQMAVDLASVKADLVWIKWFILALAGAMIATSIKVWFGAV